MKTADKEAWRGAEAMVLIFYALLLAGLLW